MTDLPRLHVYTVPGADPERDKIVAHLVETADACVHEDPDRNGCIWNWLNALECASHDTTEWSITVEDDAWPLDGWQEHLALALENAPEPFLGLTHFGQYGQNLADKGYAYGVGSWRCIWGGAVAYRRDQVKPLLEWARKVYDKTGYPNHDIVIPAFALRSGFSCALLSRAIFDQPIRASLMNHNSPGSRRPECTIETMPDMPYTGVGPFTLAGGWKEEIQQIAAEQWHMVVKGYPVEVGDVWRAGNHLFVCSDLMASDQFDEVIAPLTFDLIYCDPPWGQGLANGFRTMAGLGRAPYDWLDIYRRVAALGHARKVPVWLECSVDSSEDGGRVQSAILGPSAPYFGYTPITYSRTKPAGLYVASPTPVSEDLLARLRGQDDTKTPGTVLEAWGAPGVVVDPCSGLGATPRCAEALGWSSVNNELNPKRLSTSLVRLGLPAEKVS